MFPSSVFILLVTFVWASCKPIKSGVFYNVTVHLKGLDKTTTEDVIIIQFDDNLGSYIHNKPSEIIIIRNQNIPRLETNSVSNLSKVQKLYIANNRIRDIESGTFLNVPNLKVLNLSHNAIEEIRHGVFNNLPVKDLYLNNNMISKIAYKAFGHLHLRNLFLNNNKISRWSKDWCASSSVLVLNMRFNLVEELLPDSFHLMEKPTNDSMSIIFSNNRLRKINNNAFSGFNFKRIFLDNNLIERLDPGVFSGVKHINSLNLNNNSISEISVDLLRDTKVEILMVEDNKLKCISTDIFQMEELDIDGNPITCFCVKTWIDWRDKYSNPSIYHITNLEENCI